MSKYLRFLPILIIIFLIIALGIVNQDKLKTESAIIVNIGLVVLLIYGVFWFVGNHLLKTRKITIYEEYFQVGKTQYPYSSVNGVELVFSSYNYTRGDTPKLDVVVILNILLKDGELLYFNEYQEDDFFSLIQAIRKGNTEATVQEYVPHTEEEFEALVMAWYDNDLDYLRGKMGSEIDEAINTRENKQKLQSYRFNLRLIPIITGVVVLAVLAIVVIVIT